MLFVLKVSLIVFSTMFSSYFASITEHSFLCICKVFISKAFVRFLPMSMRIQFPLQFNAFNVRLVVTGRHV